MYKKKLLNKFRLNKNFFLLFMFSVNFETDRKRRPSRPNFGTTPKRPRLIWPADVQTPSIDKFFKPTNRRLSSEPEVVDADEDPADSTPVVQKSFSFPTPAKPVRIPKSKLGFNFF